MMEGNNFLDKKYPDLAGSKPVEKAVQVVKNEGGKTPHGRQERIEAYLERLESTIKDPRAFGLLKEKILERYVTSEDEIPESYWKLQEKIMRERGQGGDWATVTDKQKIEFKRQNSEGVLADQRASLEQWVDYFASPDSDSIPKDLKYWVFRNIVSLQEYDKEKKEFSKRSRGTVKQFPDLNHEVLAYVINRLAEKQEGKKIDWQNDNDIGLEERAEFERYLAKEDFAKLYAWGTELMNPIPEHLLPITEGEWRKYEQDTNGSENYKTLTQSVRGRGTGWCTAGESTAKEQLRNGDFHCYYTLDDNKEPTIPRIAIRMEEDKIAEVRGIAQKQNLDPYMSDVLSEKLEEFPDKELYLKKDGDMKKLTELENKIKIGQELDQGDLTFIYQLDQPIKGFGYKEDPRIQEIVSTRNLEKDKLVVFGCSEEEIAKNPQDVNENTKAYVGELLPPDIFQKGIEHIYTSFPEGRIQKFDIKVGGKNRGDLRKELKDKGYTFDGVADNILQSENFHTSADSKLVKLVRVRGRDLGMEDRVSFQEIYQRAKDFGLELCSAETGPYLRMLYSEKARNDDTKIAMEPINILDDRQVIFAFHAWDRFAYLSSDDVEDRRNRANIDKYFVFQLSESS